MEAKFATVFLFWSPRWPKQAPFWEVKFQVDFGVPKVTTWRGQGKRFAAEVGPLELKLRELCRNFGSVQHALLPLKRCGGYPKGFAHCRRPLGDRQPVKWKVR